MRARNPATGRTRVAVVSFLLLLVSTAAGVVTASSGFHETPPGDASTAAQLLTGYGGGRSMRGSGVSGRGRSPEKNTSSDGGSRVKLKHHRKHKKGFASVLHTPSSLPATLLALALLIFICH